MTPDIIKFVKRFLPEAHLKRDNGKYEVVAFKGGQFAFGTGDTPIEAWADALRGLVVML